MLKYYKGIRKTFLIIGDKMSKKKLKLSKKQKIIVLIIVLIIFLILSIAISKMLTSNVQDANNIDENLEEIQAIVERNECVYISESASQKEGFDIDIYMNFKYPPFVEKESKESFYKIVIENIAVGINYKSFRIIDNTNELEVEVKCNTESKYIISITINGEKDYFTSRLSEMSIANQMNVEDIDVRINSNELSSLIANNWKVENVNLGTKESTYQKYDIYFDEGIEVRTLNKKVYNIIFTQNYKKEVVNGLKTSISAESVKSVFGETYACDYENSIVGYRTKDFYIFFSGEQISIFPRYTYDYVEFENLLSEYNEKQDVMDFMDKLTDLWPDYNTYKYDSNYLYISYTLKGVEVSYNYLENKQGVILYENYNGSLKESKKYYDVMTYALDENPLVKQVSDKIMAENIFGNDDEDKIANPTKYSSKFEMLCDRQNERYINVGFVSTTKTNPNSQLDDTIVVYTYVWLDDDNFVYSVQNEGIYVYNAVTRNTQKIIEGTEDFKITEYDRESKILTYDGNKVLVK